MARGGLNKAALQAQRAHLKLYKKLLPSLDLKRRQLTLELEKARSELEVARVEAEALDAAIGRELPMLAASRVDPSGLVELEGRAVGVENVAGVRVPVLRAVECRVTEYPPIMRPVWVDRLAQRLRDAVEQRMRLDVARMRVDALAAAVRQITQRVNLFERMLIPEAERNIRRIRVFLGDLDREAVVRSKLTKAHGAVDRAESGS